MKTMAFSFYSLPSEIVGTKPHRNQSLQAGQPIIINGKHLFRGSSFEVFLGFANENIKAY